MIKKIIILLVIVITLSLSGCVKKDDTNYYTQEQVDELIAEIYTRDELVFNLYKDKTDKLRLQVHELQEQIIELQNE